MKTLSLLILGTLVLAACSRTEPAAPKSPPPATTITVKGEVAKPGEQPWTKDLTVSKAIEAAGGLTANGAAANINLVREKGVTLQNLDEIKAGKATDTPLMAGDVLTVPRRSGN